jgi:hypothetical protein
MPPFLRRALLIYLDPRGPWWASASLWVLLAIVGMIVWEGFVPRAGAGWPRVVVHLVFVAVLLLAVAAGFLRREQEHWYRRQLLRRGAGLCPHCGYELKGLPAERCPECGVDIAAAAREAADATRMNP